MMIGMDGKMMEDGDDGETWWWMEKSIYLENHSVYSRCSSDRVLRTNCSECFVNCFSNCLGGAME